MESQEDNKSVAVTGESPAGGQAPRETSEAAEGGVNGSAEAPAGSEMPAVDQPQTTGAAYSDYDESNGYTDPGSPNPAATELSAAPAPAAVAVAAPPPPPPPASSQQDEEEDGEEDGMLRMSFLEHLEELRQRIIKSLLGVGVAFVLSLTFVNELWQIVSAPAIEALRQVGIKDPRLAMLTPTESFQVIWVKLPILTATFLASPWILYQIWAFIAPGLYRRERRWAGPFVLCTAGLFILGGMFAYFVAFKLGLAFLLGIGVGNNVQPVVSLTEYFDLFVNVALGMGLVFELPVLIFFLALLRIVTPRWLLANSRYAILVIVIIAAIITPTPDVINLMIISVPMALLYFVGVLAAYLLTLSRERRRFPFVILFLIICGFLVVFAAGVYLAVTRFGFHLQTGWPFLVK